jgi:hypothetical protein
VDDRIANVAALRAALAELDIEGDVRSHGQVAVLVTDRPEQLADAELRARVLEIARQSGFRTLAVELPADPARDSGPTIAHADVHRA